MLDRIIDLIPHGCKIYIKEHPAQFTCRDRQRYSRSVKFYKKLLSRKNVCMISINANHYDLILNARFVVGSSMSSVAYQSIANKKTFMYFGPHVLPKEYATPLMGGGDVVRVNDKCFHNECAYYGTQDESESIAKKISFWLDSDFS